MVNNITLDKQYVDDPFNVNKQPQEGKSAPKATNWSYSGGGAGQSDPPDKKPWWECLCIFEPDLEITNHKFFILIDPNYIFKEFVFFFIRHFVRKFCAYDFKINKFFLFKLAIYIF